MILIGHDNGVHLLHKGGAGFLKVTVIDPRPSANQSTSLKSGSLFLVMVSVRPSVHTKQNKPIKELNHFSS